MESIDWQTWLYSPGMPPKIAPYDKSLRSMCDEIKDNILNSQITTKQNLLNLNSNQIIYILQNLFDSETMSSAKLKQIEEMFNLQSTKNSEIKFWWLRLNIKAKNEEIIKPTLDWLTEVGRMKFVRPLYRDLYKWDAAKLKATETFLANKHKMMHVSSYTVSKDLHLS